MNAADKILLLWDLDGTLLRSKNGTSHSSFLASMGFEISLIPGKLNGMTDFEILEVMLNSQSNKQVSASSLMAQFDNFCENSAPWEIERLISDEDLISLGKDVSHGILTGNTLRRAKLKLSAAKISSFNSSDFIFTCVPGDSRELIVNRAKEEIERLGYRAFIIGDTPRDVEAAKSCGIPAISISTGDYTYGELLKVNPKTLTSLNVSEFRKMISD